MRPTVATLFGIAAALAPQDRYVLTGTNPDPERPQLPAHIREAAALARLTAAKAKRARKAERWKRELRTEAVLK